MSDNNEKEEEKNNKLLHPSTDAMLDWLSVFIQSDPKTFFHKWKLARQISPHLLDIKNITMSAVDDVKNNNRQQIMSIQWVLPIMSSLKCTIYFKCVVTQISFQIVGMKKELIKSNKWVVLKPQEIATDGKTKTTVQIQETFERSITETPVHIKLSLYSEPTKKSVSWLGNVRVYTNPAAEKIIVDYRSDSEPDSD